MAGETAPRIRQVAISGLSWNRLVQVVMENSKDAAPVLRFDEERILDLGGEQISRGLDSMAVPYVRGRVINLRDADTGLPTGQTMTYRKLFLALYSAYMDAADERDAEPTPPGA